MRTFAICAVLLVLCAAPRAAMAQADPGDLGIFADPVGTQTVATIVPATPLRVYVVAFPPPEGIRAFEFAVRSPQTVTVSWRISSDWVSTTPLGADAWLVSMRRCALGASPAVLVQLDLLALAPVVDAPVCIGRIQGSPLNSMAGGEPAYAPCSGTGVRTFGVATRGGAFYPDGCLILNATERAPVGVERLGLGTLKARWGLGEP